MFQHCPYRLLGSIAIAIFLGELSLHAISLPPGFVASQYGTNVGTSPTAMEFAPDGRLFVCLQDGTLLVISNGKLLPTPFVTVTTDPFGERGLLGVAFDPDFADNQFVYVYYTVSTDPIHNRVSRFTADGDVAVADSETIILELDELSDVTSHNGGPIHFGPDGKLYVGVGENAYAPNAQNLTNRLGKMLRINADGTIPSDNPTTFPGIEGSSSGLNQAIWAVGLRNPYTFAFQPGTGRMFINDVGQYTWEEINDGIAGSNYAWDFCEGVCSPPDANYRDPLFQYDHGGGSTGGCAIVGAAFYNPTINQFPASYVGKYFFADLCSGWIRVLDPSNNTATDFASGLSIPIDLKVDSAGSLYYLTFGDGGQVFKVQFAPPPTVEISGTISYCSNSSPGPVPNVTLSLTGTSEEVQLSDGTGSYTYKGLASGGSYTVTPIKTALTPASDSIDAVDILAVQRHFLKLTSIPVGCGLDAADVNDDSVVNGTDALAVQRFYLGFANAPSSNVGKYQFSPASRTYPEVAGSHTDQNYDTLVFGDVSTPFAERPKERRPVDQLKD